MIPQLITPSGMAPVFGTPDPIDGWEHLSGPANLYVKNASGVTVTVTVYRNFFLLDDDVVWTFAVPAGQEQFAGPFHGASSFGGVRADFSSTAGVTAAALQPAVA